MTKHQIIKEKLEALKTNKVGKQLLSINNFASEYKYSVDDVRLVVNELIDEGKLEFQRAGINQMTNQKIYDKEYLKIIKRNRIIKRNNSHLYQ